MNKKYFAVKLVPCRPDFAQTMSESERSVMQEHAAYWREQMDHGKVIVFGPVLDPKTVYGFGVVAVDNEQDLKDFMAGDPANKINTFEYYPMLAVVPAK